MIYISDSKKIQEQAPNMDCNRMVCFTFKKKIKNRNKL